MSQVIDLGEMRIKRQARRYFEGCQHLHITLDANGDIVMCDDCGKQITAFFALETIVTYWEQQQSKMRVAQAKLDEAISLKAAQRVEKAWRSRTMVPACPHCGDPIFADDGFGGSMMSREMALRRRQVMKTASRKKD